MLSKQKLFQKTNIPFDYPDVAVNMKTVETIADFISGKPIISTLVWDDRVYPDPDKTQPAELFGVKQMKFR